MPVSSSASMTIRPEMMCSPPANRSVAETSALRQDVLSTWRRASSSFTCAVSAMAVILPFTRVRDRSVTYSGGSRVPTSPRKPSSTSR